jgi:hypothetical protein
MFAHASVHPDVMEVTSTQLQEQLIVCVLILVEDLVSAVEKLLRVELRDKLLAMMRSSLARTSMFPQLC